MDQKKIALIILIVVAVVIMIYIVHVMVVKKAAGNGGKVFVYGTFIVKTDQKSPDNQHYGHGSDQCFYFNDLEAPSLVLKRGVYYEFKNTSSEPIYFSSHPRGGEGAPGSLAKNKKKDFIGLAEGTIYFLITDDLPSEFYYQSGKHSHMGGKITIEG